MAQFYISKDPPGQRSLAFNYNPVLLPKTKIPSANAGIQFKIARLVGSFT